MNMVDNIYRLMILNSIISFQQKKVLQIYQANWCHFSQFSLFLTISTHCEYERRSFLFLETNKRRNDCTKNVRTLRKEMYMY